MTAQILNGKQLSENILSHLKSEVGRLKKKGKTAYLVSIEVGHSPRTNMFVQKMSRACHDIDILYARYQLDGRTSSQYLEREIAHLNENPEVTGILLLEPLPLHLDAKAIYTLINPTKDVEGMHPANLGKLALGEPFLAPCKAMGAFELIQSTGEPLRGKEALVVGSVENLGKAISLLLLSHLVTVKTCQANYSHLEEYAKKADILVVAARSPGLITADMVQPGAIVIDTGINRLEIPRDDSEDANEVQVKVVGDVDEKVAQVAGYLSPVPGGVGPMTVAMLLKNTLAALEGPQIGD